MKKTSYLASAIVTLTMVQALRAADVESFLVAKGQEFRQTNAAAATVPFSEQPFQAHTAVTPTAAGVVTGATLRLPNTQVVTLTQPTG